MNDDKMFTHMGLRGAFLAIITLFLIGLFYVAYRGDQQIHNNEETIRVNCISLRDNSLAMIKLHEDIAAGFTTRGQTTPPAILADLAELHRLVPTCEGL